MKRLKIFPNHGDLMFFFPGWLSRLGFPSYLYNFDPLKPHFYIVKLGFTGVYFCLISAQKHKLWVHVLVKTALSMRFLTSTQNICFEQKYEKYQNVLSEKFHCGGKILNIFEQAWFRNDLCKCLYNFDPLKPHFYIVKLDFTGVYITFSYFCSKT